MDIKNITEKEKGYLFGLFEGDGYKIYDKNSRHYQVEFYLNSLTDTKIIQFLIKLLRKINLKPNIYQDKRYNCKRIRIYSKELFFIIKKDISLTNKTKEFCLGFISGIIDSEGYVNKEKDYIMIINTNLKMIQECQNFLKLIKINSNISKRKPGVKDKKESYRMYISVSFKNTENLSIKAGKL